MAQIAINTIIGRASWRPWRAGSAIGPGICPCRVGGRSDYGDRGSGGDRLNPPTTGAIYAGMGMPVNLHGLSIADIRATVTQQAEGQGELLVTGEIKNLRAIETPLPSLRLALRGEDGRELYVWAARGPKTRLGAGERVPFRARLAAPPAGVRDVLVKFAAPGDKGSFTESPS